MKYCLIIPDFRGIGGAQLYAFRRAEYMAKKGFQPCFIVGLLDDKLIKNSNDQISIFQHHEIINLAFDVSFPRRAAVLIAFLKWSGNDISIVESFDPNGATWGELFALNIGCKHIIYSLIEPTVFRNIQDRPVHDFFKFKLQRREFIGLSSLSLEKIFGRKFATDENNYVNLPFNPNELTSISKPELSKEINGNSFVIGTISRLEKRYVEELIINVLEFAWQNKKSTFTLIIAGDSEVGNYKHEFQQKYLSNEVKPENLEIMLPGYINPLGKDFFSTLDLYIGMGTGAVSAISQSCATIVIDPITNQSSGIFGIETNNFAYSESGKQFSIFESLNNIYLNKGLLEIAKEKGRDLFEREFHFDVCMEKLDSYIDNSKSIKNIYWDLNQLGYINSFIRFLYINKNNKIITHLNDFRRWLFNQNKA